MAIAAQRKRSVIDEHQTDGAVSGSLQDIALEHRIADPQGDPGAVGAGGEHVAFGHFDLTDGLDLTGGGLGILAGKLRPRQGLRQITGDPGPGLCEQIGRRVPGKEIPNQHLGAVGTDQQKVGAFTDIVGGKQKIATRHHKRFGAAGVENRRESLAARASEIERTRVCLTRWGNAELVYS